MTKPEMCFPTVCATMGMQYILRRRLLHGIYAMKQGRAKTEAALDYGFDTYAGFYRAFCREFGATPSDFLAACRAKRPCRVCITQEEPMTVTHKKAARILENWNLGSETITDIYYEGTGNRNESACYVGEEYVLKYTSNPGRMKKNMELSRALDNVGLLSALPVPAVNGADCITDGEVYYYLTRRLPGNTMASRRFNREKGVFTGEIIGRLHLALAGLDACTGEADLVEKLRSWALPAAKDILKLSESFCREYLGSFAALYEKLPRQIIHRDPHPGNILCEGDKWGFLDFELAERNVRIYDPCYAATAVLSETFDTDREGWIDIFRALLRGYDSVVGLTPEERRAVPYVILANQFVCVAWFAGQEKYAEIFETNRRMTLWLLERMEELKKF